LFSNKPGQLRVKEIQWAVQP